MDRTSPQAEISTARWSVTTLLFWLVLACLLPGIFGATALFLYEYEQRQAQLEGDVVQTARALVQAVDNQILRAQALVQGLAAADSLTNGDFKKFHGQALEVLAQSQLGSTVSLNDRDAQQLVNTARKFGTALPRNGNPGLVRRVFETGRPVVSDVFISSVQGNPVTAVGVPVPLNGATAYALTVTILPETLNGILRAQGLPLGWVATIFDSTGTIVARSREPERYVGRKPRKDYLQQLMKSDENIFEASIGEGPAGLVAHTRSTATNWRVAISISRELLAAQLTQRLFALGMGILLLFAVGLGLAWYIGQKLARSFQALIPSAIALGAGELVSLPRADVREAAELTQAMDEAARILKERTSALQESESRFRSTFEQTIVGLAHVALDGRLLRINARFAQIVGHDREALLRRTFQEITHPDDLAADMANMEKCLSGSIAGYSMEKRYIRQDGTAVWCNLTATLVRNPGSGGHYFVSVIEDIQARKEAEWALADEREARQRLLAQQVEERTAEVAHSNEALMRSNIELKNFAHAAAHDLQTPLRSIAGFAHFLQESARPRLEEKEIEWLALITNNTRRLQDLIQELLSYTRLDTQARPREETDLAKLCDDVQTSLSNLIGEASAEVTCRDLPALKVDRVQFAQLLQNLIENALKYRSDRPPRISISCRRGEEEWIFSVADNGIGIEPKYQQRIFEIFKRLHTYTDIPGTGIGLAICQRIVEGHGGRIWVESAPGQGSVFYFTVPANPPQISAQ